MLNSRQSIVGCSIAVNGLQSLIADSPLIADSALRPPPPRIPAHAPALSSRVSAGPAKTNPWPGKGCVTFGGPDKHRRLHRCSTAACCRRRTAVMCRHG